MSSAVLSFITITALSAIIGVLLSRNKNARQRLLMDAGLEKEVHAMLEQSQDKIAAVKLVRRKTGAGLLEAKQFVNRVKENKGPFS
ncbi:ribosomal protein L7/L12 [Domibacillus indicus]|uniref:ribosomal protein L7/L12 n=1 Tax=Domibacillus indicus TaxID=1437523 RepID=UPI000617B138|nr:ribosomal protein L7/L12 [Domibacillus indicus]